VSRLERMKKKTQQSRKIERDSVEVKHVKTGAKQSKTSQNREIVR
jgi:hypothetical protein